MSEIIFILSKEMCGKHSKHPQCKMSHEGLEIKACCADFNGKLMGKLKEFNTKGTSSVR